MIDTSSIDLLNLIDRDTNLKKVASTGGGEYHGPCPFCGGKDRFVVQPYHTNGGRWFCRHCASPWQDAVEYVKKRYTNGDFRAAVKFLHLESQLESSSPQYTSPDARRARRSPDSPNRPASLQEDYLALTNRGWQAAAKQFVRESKQRLWSPEGRTVLDYLRQRGLTDKIIARAHLGYCPSYKKAKWGGESVSLRRSVVIPWWIEGQFWRVRFRQLDKKLKPVGDDDQKYIQVAGGANGLYGADAIFHGCSVVITESEFDALVIRAHASSLVAKGLVPVATGGTTNAHLLKWLLKVSLAQKVLLAFDVDENGAGDKAAAWWTGFLGRKALRLRPTQHDVTDMVQVGDNLESWLADALM